MLSKGYSKSQARFVWVFLFWQHLNSRLSTKDCTPKINIILYEGYGVHKDGTKCKRRAQRNCCSGLMKHFLSEIFQVNDGLSFQTTYQLVEIIIALVFHHHPHILNKLRYWNKKHSRDIVQRCWLWVRYQSLENQVYGSLSEFLCTVLKYGDLYLIYKYIL